MRLWRALSGDQQRAGIAAAALFVTLFLPWYRTSQVVQGRILRDNLSAFEVFTFVEAGVLVVAAAVLYLLYARARQRAFHLPGGDGWAVTIAGGWVVFLLAWRLFDKPDVPTGTVGVQWGLFTAMAVGAVVAAAGQRMRAAHLSEPPNPAEDPGWEVPPRPPRGREEHPRRRPVDSTALTEVLRDERPAWQGEPPDPPPAGRARRRPPEAPPPPPAPPPAPGRRPPPPPPPGAATRGGGPAQEDDRPVRPRPDRGAQ